MYEEKELEKRVIIGLLREMSLSRKYKGYKVLFHSLLLLLDDAFLVSEISKGLYVDVSAKLEIDIYSVERNLRTIKQILWIRHPGHPVFRGYNDCPSNAEFLDIMVFEVQRRLDIIERLEMRH